MHNSLRVTQPFSRRTLRRAAFRRVSRVGRIALRLASWVRLFRATRPARGRAFGRGASGYGSWNEIPPEDVDDVMTLVPDPESPEPPDMPGQGHLRLPCSKRMQRETGPGIPVGARRHLLSELLDPKLEERLPSGHWSPPSWFRMDHKYGAGYPQVWMMDTETKSPERPYLLRLDLARILPESDEPIEEKFVTSPLRTDGPQETEKIAPPLFAPLYRAALERPTVRASRLPWLEPPRFVGAIDACSSGEAALAVEHLSRVPDTVEAEVPGGRNHG